MRNFCSGNCSNFNMNEAGLMFITNLKGMSGNRPFSSFPQSFFQSECEKKCEIFVLVIVFNFNINEAGLMLITKPSHVHSPCNRVNSN